MQSFITLIQIKPIMFKLYKHHELKDGQYYYRVLGRGYAVYKYHNDGNGYGSGDKIKDNLSLQQAKDMVYRLNGWFR